MNKPMWLVRRPGMVFRLRRVRRQWSTLLSL